MTKLQLVRFLLILLFVCKCCTAVILATHDNELNVGNSVLLKTVDNFCYLHDVLDAYGWCDLAVTARIRSACEKSCQCLPVVTGN